MPVIAVDDSYPTWSRSPHGPYQHAAAVTPSDTDDLTNTAYALYVGVAGDIVVITAGGETVTIKAALAGTVLPIVVTRVKATNTTATNLLALR